MAVVVVVVVAAVDVVVRQQEQAPLPRVLLPVARRPAVRVLPGPGLGLRLADAAVRAEVAAAVGVVAVLQLRFLLRLPSPLWTFGSRVAWICRRGVG